MPLSFQKLLVRAKFPQSFSATIKIVEVKKMRKIRISKKKELTKRERFLINFGTFVLTTALGVGLEEIINYLFDFILSLIKHLFGLQ